MTRFAVVTAFSSLVLVGACDKHSTPAAAGSDASASASPAASDEVAPAEPAGASVEAPETPTQADAAPAAEQPDAVPTPPEPEPPEEPVEPPNYKVLLLGDSLMATGFGALLEQRLDAHPQITAYRKGKSSSGLARPDFFDWMAESKRQVDLREPDVVIVLLGGNDGQDLTHRTKKAGRRVPWQHENWEASYRERMDSFLAGVSAPDRDIVWLGMPTMGLRSLEKKLVTIRDVQKAAVEDHASATYIDMVPLASNDDGGMRTHAEVGPKNKRQAIRAEDRIHFTMAGSEYFADALYPKVLETLEVDDATPAEK